MNGHLTQVLTFFAFRFQSDSTNFAMKQWPKDRDNLKARFEVHFEAHQP